MSILDKVTRLEKRLQQLSRRDDVAPEPVEVRRGILDDVEDMARPAGRSRRVFPYNRLRIHVLAPDAAARAAMKAVLGADEEMLAAVRQRLQEVGCTIPAGLEVKLQLARKAGPAWPPARAWHIAPDLAEAPAGESRAAGAPAGGGGQDVETARPLTHLAVVQGAATRRSYPLRGDRLNIGRQAEVLDRDRRVVRRNQVVFEEADDGITQTVSRAHAHIRISASGECRLFDDRSSYGTRIFRGGETITVQPGSARGVKLREGDEVYLGRACLRVAGRPQPERKK